MIRLKFPEHCKERIQERGLQIDHIKQAIQKPDVVKPAYEGRMMARKKIDKNRTIEVIYCKEGTIKKTNDYLVITAYYLTS